MNKYKVKVTHFFSEIIDVEAENNEEAKQKVVELIQADDFQGNPGYETTVPPEHWNVITEEDFQEMVKSFKEKMEEDTPRIITP